MADTPTFWQEAERMVGSAAGGGVAFRYIRILAQTAPTPDGDGFWGSRWYGWAYRFTQTLLDNNHLIDQEHLIIDPSKGGQEGGGPKK